MKRSMLYLALGSTLLSTTFMSCNENGKKGDNTAYEEKSASSANDVIEYTNLIVDLSNKNSAYVVRLVDNADNVTKRLTDNRNPMMMSGIIKPIMINLISHGKVKVEEPVDALNKTDQAFFKTHVTNFKTAFDKVKATYTLLDDYLKAQDYKDDKGVKGLALADSIRSQAQVFFDEKGVLMKRVNEVADASEIIILKDSPVKDYVVAMKADMQAVRNYIDLLEEGGEDYAKIADKAQAAYDKLEKDQAAHAAMDMANATKAGKEGYYKSFYDSFHDFLLAARKIQRDAKEKGAMTNSQLETLDGDLDTMIGRYNTFTK
ncbi:DUF3829 domain-containing protein [Chitinophaga arvensicola]|uniref:DUF3829 domain-containing protein n=1 Tax=Chitinophaga arvensicola TaxID=29529 RepID=A0A1I0SBR7_9BACT|nr:DUF3829 domain-containing protein [Chitinophaga arvensicola]SEW54210.1 Protein of unknown function [Chitinophaga arvensicola]